MPGPQELVDGLRELGCDARLLTAEGHTFAVIDGYEVLCGRFQNRIIDLGFLAPTNYPDSIGAAMHVRATPQLFETHDTQKRVRNILQSQLGPDWRYWSRNFGPGPHKPSRLLAKVNAVFRDA